MAAIPKDDEEKKKRGNYGDAAAASLDRSVNQIDTGPMVGKPGDFPVNPDGTPMSKAAAGFQPGAMQPPTKAGSFPGVSATLSGMADDVRAAVGAGNYGKAAGEAFRGTSALPLAVADDVILNPARKIGGFISGVTGPATEFGKEFGRAALGMQPGPAAQQGQKLTLAGDATMPGNDSARFMAQPVGQTVSAPDGTPKAPEQATAPVQQAPGKELPVVEPPKQAAGFIPAQIRHSGNDWQARNDLRNLEVSASSITAAPNGKEMMAYRAGLEADKALKEGKNPAIESQNRDAAFMDRTQAGENAANYRADIVNNIAQQRVNQEGVKLGFESKAAAQVQALQQQIVNETDPKKLAVLQEKLQTITGKYQRPEPANRLTVVPGGSSVDEKTGQVVQRPSLVVDEKTGNVINVHGGQAQAPLPNHVEALKKDRSLAKQFDEIYGAGASAKILGGK